MSTLVLRCGWCLLLVPALQAQAVEVRRLESLDPEGFQYMGWSVALSGQRALVGAPYERDQGLAAGAAYVFERGPAGWAQVAQLHASDGEEGYYFGIAVQLEGDRALVASPGDDDPVPHTGAVYVFERDAAGQWNETGKLETGRPGEGLGYGLALQGDRAVIGAPYPPGSGSLPGHGLAFVFERDAAGQWHEMAMLSASDAVDHDAFGYSLALSGERILVGANLAGSLSYQGQAYVFERDPGGTWIERAVLTAGDASASDRFGYAVALAGERALIGAWKGDGAAEDSGSAYVFERDPGGAWLETAELSASDGQFNDQFGTAVALSESRSLIGAAGDNDGPPFGTGHNAGSAYAFALDASGAWHEASKLVAHDGDFEDWFGNAVALQGDLALVGASQSDGFEREAGATYVFDLEPLSTDVDEISLGRGGVQALEIDAGFELAGFDYLVLGSLSGTSPGLPLPRGFHLPLNPDGYFLYALARPTRPPLRDSFGQLDSTGHARASFALLGAP